jgi:hypothetical protein
MKRLFQIFLSLVIGAALFCAFRSAAVRYREEVSARRQACSLETQSLNRAREEHVRLTTRIHQLKESVLALPQNGGEKVFLANVISTNGACHLSPEVREKLLAELGFDWNSLPDYVVVSKDSLPRLGVHPIRASRLTDTICSVLAVTSEERARIDSLLADATAQYNAWALAHVQRGQPEGDTLAQYTIPVDQTFSQSLSNVFASGIAATLGSERGTLLMDYAASWLVEVGMNGTSPTVLTVKRPPAGQEQLPFELKTPGGGTMQTSITTGQPVPQAFLPIFPGGWADLAAREGFQLPNPVRKQ